MTETDQYRSPADAANGWEDGMTSDPMSAYVAEFQSLRTEAVTHFTFANALIGLEIAMIGVSVSISDKAPVLFVAFSILTSMIWLSYMDHITSIHRIALYVGSQLRERIEAASGEPVLEWETWLRELRSSGIAAMSPTRRIVEKHREPRLGLTFPSIFYGSTSTAFLGYSSYQTFRISGLSVLWPWLAFGIAALALSFAIRQSTCLSALIGKIDQALLGVRDARI